MAPRRTVCQQGAAPPLPEQEDARRAEEMGDGGLQEGDGAEASVRRGGEEADCRDESSAVDAEIDRHPPLSEGPFSPFSFSRTPFDRSVCIYNNTAHTFMASWHGLSLPQKSSSEGNSSDSKPVCSYAVAFRGLRYKGLADVLTERQLKAVTKNLVGDQQALAQVAFDIFKVNVTRIGKEAVGFTIVHPAVVGLVCIEQPVLVFTFSNNATQLLRQKRGRRPDDKAYSKHVLLQHQLPRTLFYVFSSSSGVLLKIAHGAPKFTGMEDPADEEDAVDGLEAAVWKAASASKDGEHTKVKFVRMTEKSNGKNAISSFFRDRDGGLYLLLCSKNTPMILPYSALEDGAEKDKGHQPNVAPASKPLLISMFFAWREFWQACTKEMRERLIASCLKGVTAMWEHQDGKHMVAISQARQGRQRPFAELTVPIQVDQIGDLSKQYTLPYDAVFKGIPALNRVPAFELSWEEFLQEYKSLCFRNPFRPKMQTEGYVAEFLDAERTVLTRFKIKNWSYVLYRSLREWIRSKRGSFSDRLKKKNRSYMKFSPTVLNNVILFCVEGAIPLIDEIAADLGVTTGGLTHFQDGIGMGEVSLAIEKRLGMSLADCFTDKFAADHRVFFDALSFACSKVEIKAPFMLRLPVRVVTPDPDPVRTFLNAEGYNRQSLLTVANVPGNSEKAGSKVEMRNIFLGEHFELVKSVEKLAEELEERLGKTISGPKTCGKKKKKARKERERILRNPLRALYPPTFQGSFSLALLLLFVLTNGVHIRTPHRFRREDRIHSVECRASPTTQGLTIDQRRGCSSA